MLGELIQLWPGGPELTLGTYFVVCQYVFSFLFVLWCVSLLRWSDRFWLVFGALLLLAASSLAALQHPLARPYGMTDDARVDVDAVRELGEVMVVAARGTASESRLVAESHPFPLWGLFVGGSLAGFRPERLLQLYSWLPLLSLVSVGLAVAWLAASLEEDEALPAGVLPVLATFFVVFLSAHRLSFLTAEGPLWPSFFWMTPRLGVGLAGACVGARLLASRSRVAWLGAAVVLGGLGWTSPSLALGFALAAAVWIVTGGRTTWVRSAPVVLGVLSFLPFVGSGNWGSWNGSVHRALSVTVDLGVVFLLAALGVVLLWRSRRAPERLLASLAITAMFLWVFFGSMDSGASGGAVRFWVALTAGYGFYRAVVHMGAADAWSARPSWLRRYPPARLTMAACLALSLPWCFPFWWAPARMDPVYVESVPPVSRRLLGMGESIRRDTDPDAVFAAGPSYAPWVSALGGRRILMVEAADDSARGRAQSWFVDSKDPEKIASAAAEWSLTHIAWGRLDQPASADEGKPVDFGFFTRSPLFEERFRDARFVRVFEYVPQATRAPDLPESR